MPNQLIFNPHVRLDPVADGSDEIVVSAAKRTVGIQTLRVSRTENLELFELLSELAATNLDFFDPETDLSLANRELLQNYGIITSRDDQPQKPCFSCALDDVPSYVGQLDKSDLLVNPTFRFEPFDLANFAHRLHYDHISPYQPSVWITAPATAIEMGYWLTADQAAIVSTLVAGEPIEIELEESLLRKLAGANILVCEQSVQTEERLRTAEIAQASADFAKNGCAVIGSLLPEHQMAAMRRFYRQYVEEGFMPFGDAQVAGRFQQHREPFASFLHRKLLPIMTLVADTEVKLSYVYAASYCEGAALEPHRDRPQCEFSISFQVDFQPHLDGHRSSWPLYVEQRVRPAELVQSPALATIDESSSNAFFLKSGDGLFYRGHELAHFRPPLPRGQSSTSLFFHFVPAAFPGSLD